MSLCPSCREGELETDASGETICMCCGYVDESTQLVTDPSYQPVSFEKAKNNRYSRPPRETYQIINSLSETLQLNKADKSKAKKYFKILNDSDDCWPSGNYGKLRALSCIYFVIKHNSPISLTKMANDCQVSRSQLGKAVKYYDHFLKNDEEQTTQAIVTDSKPNHPSLYVESCLSSLKPSIEPENRLKLVHRCKFLIDFSADNCLSEGRNPLGIAAAAIFLTLESFKMKTYLSKSQKKKICDTLDISIFTANERYKELQQLLITKAKIYFPWEIKEKELVDNFDELEKLLISERNTKKERSVKDNSPSNSCVESLLKEKEVLPPSFIASEKARNIRKEKLLRAKERIQKTLTENNIDGLISTKTEISKEIENDEKESDNSVKWDDEDLLIESLLLKGVSEEQILEGYYQTGFEGSQPILHDIDSEQIDEQDMPDEEVSTYIPTLKRKSNPSGNLPNFPSKKFCF